MSVTLVCDKGADGGPCGNAIVGRKTAGQCARCWISMPENRGLSTTAVPLVSKRRVPLPLSPCVHVGRPMPPPNGSSTLRTYFFCDARLEVVTRCACGSKCSKYLPETSE